MLQGRVMYKYEYYRMRFMRNNSAILKIPLRYGKQGFSLFFSYSYQGPPKMYHIWIILAKYI